MAKHVFVTGGVVSSLGKGLTAASIGALLEGRGLRIMMQKLDPYLNVDPGTMSPYQHGEVYVTDDGAETDLDLGHYERFTSVRVNRHCNCTTGSIYESIIRKERRGDFLGNTVQVIPHVTTEIKDVIKQLATPNIDVVITEIGGTVGDIESLPFLEAIRQMRQDVGRENVLYIHLTLVPYLRAAQEIKSKPTQHSVGTLREIGIQPDILICRTEVPLPDDVRGKISLFCNVEKEAVIEELDVEKSIYEVPLMMSSQRVDQLVISKLNLKANDLNIDPWLDMLHVVRNPRNTISVAVVGKYIEHQDAYKSIYEALQHGGIACKSKVNTVRVEAEEVSKHGAAEKLSGVHGILVAGGFGTRGTQGKVEAVRYARENNIPYFGICLGMQCAVIEFARNVLGLKGANSTEFDSNTLHPVIDLLPEQRSINMKGGTMRLGSWPARLAPDSRARELYGAEKIQERHRHRYEFNNDFRQAFEDAGMFASGVSPDGTLVEIVEIRGHPHFVATQFHPEFKSRPVSAHPLFAGFIAAALKHAGIEVDEESVPDEEDA